MQEAKHGDTIERSVRALDNVIIVPSQCADLRFELRKGLFGVLSKARREVGQQGLVISTFSLIRDTTTTTTTNTTTNTITTNIIAPVNTSPIIANGLFRWRLLFSCHLLLCRHRSLSSRRRRLLWSALTFESLVCLVRE